MGRRSRRKSGLRVQHAVLTQASWTGLWCGEHSRREHPQSQDPAHDRKRAPCWHAGGQRHRMARAANFMTALSATKGHILALILSLSLAGCHAESSAAPVYYTRSQGHADIAEPECALTSSALPPSRARRADIPAELVGLWVIQKILPTMSLVTMDDAQATAILGSEIEYTRHSFRWKHLLVSNPFVNTYLVNSTDFTRSNSGTGSGAASHVTFEDLGIRGDRARCVSIYHQYPDRDMPSDRCGVPIPGDAVLFKSALTIVFSVCGWWFEAYRK